MQPTPPPRPGRNSRLILFLSCLLAILLGVVWLGLQSRPYVIPEEAKRANNPLARTDEALNAARKNYGDFCAHCHGDTGKGDGSDAAKYMPGPTDLTDPTEIAKRTDGELFYIVTAGKKPMPAFHRKLKEEQRWQLVMLIRWMAEKK